MFSIASYPMLRLICCLWLQGMNLSKTLPQGIRNSKLIPPREFDENGTYNIMECEW